MRFPIILAHGQGLPGMFVIGVPAMLLGLSMISIGIYRARRSKRDAKKSAWLTMFGVALLGLALFSPKLDSIVFWMFDHFPLSQ